MVGAVNIDFKLQLHFRTNIRKIKNPKKKHIDIQTDKHPVTLIYLSYLNVKDLNTNSI